MKASLLLCISSIFALTGCATGYPVTYNSIPQGATVICGNSVKGTTPYTGYTSAAILEELADIKRRWEQRYEEERAKGTSERVIDRVKAENAAIGCRAIWASGATAIYEEVDADTAKARPNGIDLLVNHPGDANTRTMDSLSGQVQQLQPQQQQVQSQQQPIPVFQPTPLPAMPATSFPSAPGRSTTVCRTLSNGTVVCD